MIFTEKSLPTPDVIRNLGMRFRDYRLRMNLTQKEISEAAAISKTTLSKFESGNVSDISLGTLLRLLKAIGLSENWNTLLPELPESPYLYNGNMSKKQRVRHSSKK